MLPPTAWLRRALLQPYQKLPAAGTPVSYQPSETPAFWWINPILTTASKRPCIGREKEGQRLLNLRGTQITDFVLIARLGQLEKKM